MSNFDRIICGIGYIGNGKYIPRGKPERVWQSMLLRCYSDNYREQYPTYIGCTVIDEWHNFQNFCIWFKDNYIDGYYLDKDLKFYGNKQYSYDACTFVPNRINTFFSTRERYNNLEMGIVRYGTGYSKRGNNKKVRQTTIEAKNDYWNDKYKIMKELISEYPEFKTLLINYFEHFFGEHYG
jgi:hypothetical protein